MSDFVELMVGATASGCIYALVALSYVGLLALYSGPLKHVVIIDVGAA